MSRQGTYHQDYIARIRYSNTLPPPPNPPKLLDIPGTGLGGDQYLSAAYASRLAREQPLNIEADGELGMPIDLVGIPGVFHGDESAINGLAVAPTPHPHDKALLRPLNQLGKPASMTQGVSFLRRTEYISSDLGRPRMEGAARSSRQTNLKRKATGAERDDDPVRMLRTIYKGFDVAYPHDAYKGPDTEDKIRGDAISASDQAAWDRPRHPTNPDLKPLDTYPILPDLGSSPQYWVFKFATNPVAPSDTYDTRLDFAILEPKDPFPGASEQYQAQVEAYAADTSAGKPVQPAWDFHLYLPEDQTAVEGLRTAFDPQDASRNDRENYAYYDESTERPYARFVPQRTYETFQANDYTDGPLDASIVLALHDTTDDAAKGRLTQTAAYYYPITHRSGIRSKRGQNLQQGLNGMAGGYEESEDPARRKRPWDYMGVKVRELQEQELARIRDQRAIQEGEGEADSAMGTALAPESTAATNTVGES